MLDRRGRFGDFGKGEKKTLNETESENFGRIFLPRDESPKDTCGHDFGPSRDVRGG
jgi:hypothetical protein